jgi:type I restriction enzyme S subunit
MAETQQDCDAAGHAVPTPPAVKQQAIADFVEREVSRLDALVAEAERSMQLLAERRSALISAAVTGQIDVRDAA